MSDAHILFAIISTTLLMLIWGHWRFDVVAFVALMVAVLLGVVPASSAFTGFANPAVITVGCVMVITQAIVRSGLVDVIVKKIEFITQNIFMHVGSLVFLAAILSAFMNNIGALALLLPVALKTANKMNRSPSILLMPLAFGSMLGGLMTVIGTPPNLLISSFREKALGESYAMFDFAPVGIVLMIFGGIFLTLFGWMIVPERRKASKQSEDMYQIEEYLTEVKITEGSKVIGKTVKELEDMIEEKITLVGIIRNKRRRLIVKPDEELFVNDILIIEGSHQALDNLVSKTKVILVEGEIVSIEILKTSDIMLMEAVVAPDARIEGRSSASMRLRTRFGLNILAIARRGKPFKERLREVKMRAGDVALLQGAVTTIQENAVSLGFLPLQGRGVLVGLKKNAIITVLLFAIAIVLTALRIVPVQIAFACTVLTYVLLEILPVRDVYESVDWPVIILLGAMLPLGTALESTGATLLITNTIMNLAGDLSPLWILVILMIISMTLSDIMNNAATVVVLAPIAISIANTLNVNVDPFLMTVAVGASCAFMTPIGHQNNTIVMGPGGYIFSDYPRLGIFLELIVLALGVPMILWIWPF